MWALWRSGLSDRRISEFLSAGSFGLAAIERRIHERILVNIEVDYRADDTFLFAYITDISAMGIFIRTEAPETPGTHLMLSFTTPTGEAMELEGEVIWINPPRPEEVESRNAGMGVQFIDLHAEQRDRILRLVRTFAYLDDEKSPTDC